MNNNYQAQVLAHLKQGKTISQEVAIHHFNCYRLSAVIQLLHMAGHNIVTYNEHNLNGIGSNAHDELKELQ